MRHTNCTMLFATSLIAGVVMTAGFVMHGQTTNSSEDQRFRHYTITDLGNRFVATGINNHGVIIGGGNDPQTGAVIWFNGQMTFFQSLIPISSASAWRNFAAYGINDAGDIVGYGYYVDNTFHGFLSRGG